MADPARAAGAGVDDDLFAVLGLPARFDLDPAALDARVRALARDLHPDRFARADPAARRAALARATRVNDARRVLRAWPARAAYLLRRAGVDPDAAAADPAFLEAQLAAREALEAARAAGDAGACAAIAREARTALAAVEAEVRAAFAAPGWEAPESARRIARALARVAFLERTIAAADGDPGR